MNAPGTTQKLIRNLAHLLPPPKGSKFADAQYPTQHRHRAKYVPVKDRFPFWNITVGDTVVLRRGKEVDTAKTEDSKEDKVMPRGIVISLDREKNWLWLRDIDEKTRLAPKQLRHIQPRLIDPDAGPEKGYGPNVMEVPKPVHYSQCRLVVPGREDSPAIRLTRSKPYFNASMKAFQWKRFAILKNKEGKREKIHVPWPKTEEVKRQLNPSTSPKSLISLSTFVPWDPRDPINLSSKKSRVSPQSTLRALIALTQSRSDKQKSEASNPGPKYAFHEGMKVKSVKPPPIAQAPSPDETLWMRRQEIKSWSNDPTILENFAENGGRSFVGEDYLKLTPDEGPWSGLTDPSSSSRGKGGNQSSQTLAKSKEEAREERERERERNHQGELIKDLDPVQLDALPIELLMKDDLSNEKGLKFRMRNYQEKLERKRKAEEKRKSQEATELKALREKILAA